MENWEHVCQTLEPDFHLLATEAPNLLRLINFVAGAVGGPFAKRDDLPLFFLARFASTEDKVRTVEWARQMWGESAIPASHQMIERALLRCVEVPRDHNVNDFLRLDLGRRWDDILPHLLAFEDNQSLDRFVGNAPRRLRKSLSARRPFVARHIESSSAVGSEAVAASFAGIQEALLGLARTRPRPPAAPPLDICAPVDRALLGLDVHLVKPARASQNE